MNVLDYIGKNTIVKLRYLPQGYADVYVNWNLLIPEDL